MPLLLSVLLRTPILLLATPTVFLHFFLGETTRDSETCVHLVACIEMINRHSDRQLIVYSADVYKSLSLSHVFISALSTSNIRPSFHLPSCLAHWALLLSIESRIDGPSVGQALVLLHASSSSSFSCVHLTRAPSSVFRSFTLLALSSPLYDFKRHRHPLVSPEF